MAGVEELPLLKRLNLSCNLLTEVTSLKALTQLEVLNLSHNRIEKLDRLMELARGGGAGSTLRELDLNDNLIADIDQLAYLSGIRSLESAVF